MVAGALTPSRSRALPAALLVLVLVALAGCGGSGSAGRSTSSISTTTVSPAVARGEVSGAGRVTPAVETVFGCLHTAHLLPQAQKTASSGPSVGGGGPGAQRGYAVALKGYRHPVVLTVYDNAADAVTAAKGLAGLLATSGGFATSVANAMIYSDQHVPQAKLAPIEHCASS
jgi:hypothetical protein